MNKSFTFFLKTSGSFRTSLVSILILMVSLQARSQCSISDLSVSASASNFLCEGSTTITTSSSDNGIDYYLRNDSDNSIIDGPMIGDGSGLVFNTGNIVSTTTYNVYGEVSNSSQVLFFEENTSNQALSDYGDFNGNPFSAVSSSSPWTIEYWAQFNTGTGPSWINTLGSASGAGMIEHDLTNGYVFVRGSSGQFKSANGTQPTDNNWHHYAFVWDGTTAAIYIDGELVGLDGGGTFGGFQSGDVWELGRHGGAGYAGAMDGMMDEFRMWTSARNSSEIVNSMASVDPNSANLVAYYDFEEVSGNVASDLTGNGYDITFPNYQASDRIEAVYDVCSLEMTQTATITIEPLSDLSVSASASNFLCEGSTTITTGSSQNGASYFLRDDSDNSIIDGPVVGDGSGLTFNTGTLNSTTTFNVVGEKKGSSKALDFDGVDDYVDLGTINATTLNQYTISYWFKTDAIGSQNISIFSAGGGWQLSPMINTSGVLQFYAHHTGGWQNTGYTVANNTWEHHTWTFSGSVINFYVNGVEQYSDAKNAMIGTGGWRIGSSPSTGPSKSVIDDFYVWNDVRSATEVAADAGSCTDLGDINLINAYTFDEGSGSVLYDQVGSFNGNLTNMDETTDWVDGQVVCATSVCSIEMTNKPTVTIDPLVDQTFTAASTTVAPGADVDFTIDASQVDVNYYLRNDVNDTIFAGPVAGTGSAIIINTGTLSETITFNVYQEHTSGSCVAEMTQGTETVNVDGTAPSFTSSATANYEENGTGVAYTATADETVTFTLGNTKDESLFTLTNGNEISFTSAPDYESPADGDLDNAYVIDVIATDAASNATTLEVTITVTDHPDPVESMLRISNLDNASGTPNYQVKYDFDSYYTQEVNSSLGIGFTTGPEATASISFKTYMPNPGDDISTIECRVYTKSGDSPDVLIGTLTPVQSIVPVDNIVEFVGNVSLNASTSYIIAMAATEYGTSARWNYANSPLTYSTSGGYTSEDGSYYHTLTGDTWGKYGGSALIYALSTGQWEYDFPASFTSSTSASYEENGTGVAYTAAADEAVTFTLGSSKDEALFTLTNDNEISFATSPDYESPADGDLDNAYVIDVIATDAGSNETTLEVTITVTDVDEIDPTFTSSSIANFEENGSGVAYTATADEAVTFTLGSTKDEAQFTLANDNEISFVSSPDYESPGDGDANNTYVIDVIATDAASNATTLEVTITVTNANDNDPVITSANAVNIDENELVIFALTATDADGTTSFSFINSAGSDATMFGVSGNDLVWLAAPDYENPSDANGDNIYEVTITVSDGENTSDQNIIVTVLDVFTHAGDTNEDGTIGAGEVAGDMDGDGNIGAGEIAGDMDGDGSIGAGEIAGDTGGDGTIGAGEVAGDVDGDGSIGAGELAGDVNGDGTIGAGEVAGDTDGDGTIGAGEIAGDVNGDGVIGAGEIAGDIDGDGTIGAGEVAGDADGDGVIGAGEIAGDIDGDGTIGAGEVAGDTDGDGTIGDGEVAGDTDGDGTIGAGEVAGDTDGDGTIGAGEIAGDADGNGTIGAGEVAGDIDGDGTIGAGEVAGDTDGDGTIGAGEIAGDVNGDGVIGAGEIAGDADGNGTIGAGEVAGDIDGDGTIGAGEVAGDTDGDGTIGAGEIAGDADGDGTIGAGEVAGDTDGDGAIGAGEIAGDIDGDGTIGAGEVAGDTDGDGTIGAGEVAGDTDGDGEVGDGEVVGDTNGDGEIGDGETEGDADGDGEIGAGETPVLGVLEVEVTVYPNPSSDFIQVRSSERLMIEVIDLEGHTLIRSQSNKQIDIQSLSNGVYFMVISDQKGNTTTERFIKR